MGKTSAQVRRGLWNIRVPAPGALPRHQRTFGGREERDVVKEADGDAGDGKGHQGQEQDEADGVRGEEPKVHLRGAQSSSDQQEVSGKFTLQPTGQAVEGSLEAGEEACVCGGGRGGGGGCYLHVDGAADAGDGLHGADDGASVAREIPHDRDHRGGVEPRAVVVRDPRKESHLCKAGATFG